MDATLVIKIFSLIPGLKNWAIRRFSKIEITPINGQGNNIFHKYTEEDKFFVKIKFYIKSYTDIDLLDIKLEYGNGFPVTKNIIELNGDSMETDGNYRMSKQVNLESGKIYEVFLSKTFHSTGSEKDNDVVNIKFEINVPSIPGVLNKSASFELSESILGALTPESTTKIRIF